MLNSSARRTPRQLRQVPPLYEVVRLEEDLAEARLAQGVILQIKLVEAMERVLVRVHVKRIDREVIRRQVERLEDLLQRELLAVTENDDVLNSI